MIENKMSFKSHNSFHLRSGWLTKVLELDDANMFRTKVIDQSEVLGMGSTMTKAVRFYLTSMGLIKNTAKKVQFTELGLQIKESDPYIENYFTLFILHYELAKNFEKFTSLNMFFNDLDQNYVSKSELNELIKNKALEFDAEKVVPNVSIDSDINCIQGLFYSEKNKNLTPEDNYTSPFVDLELIEINKNHEIKKKLPNLKKLDKHVILYCLLRQISNELTEKIEINEYISIEALSIKRNSIGKLLNLDRSTIFHYLEELEELGYLKIQNTAGLDQVYIKRELSPIDIIKLYCERI